MKLTTELISWHSNSKTVRTLCHRLKMIEMIFTERFVTYLLIGSTISYQCFHWWMKLSNYGNWPIT